MKTIPNYHPPQDYRRPTKTQEKVYVPVNDYPEINFSMIANPLTLLTKPSLLPPPYYAGLDCPTCPAAGSALRPGLMNRLALPYDLDTNTSFFPVKLAYSSAPVATL